MGASAFESIPSAQRDFKYGYKFVIKDESDKEITKSEVYSEDILGSECQVVDHVMKLKWKRLKGVTVKAGHKFHYATWISFSDGHTKSYCTRDEKNIESIENTDKGLFDIENSPLDNNQTKKNCGLIPGLLYHLL